MNPYAVDDLRPTSVRRVPLTLPAPSQTTGAFSTRRYSSRVAAFGPPIGTLPCSISVSFWFSHTASAESVTAIRFPVKLMEAKGPPGLRATSFLATGHATTSHAVPEAAPPHLPEQRLGGDDPSSGCRQVAPQVELGGGEPDLAVATLTLHRRWWPVMDPLWGMFPSGLQTVDGLSRWRVRVLQCHAARRALRQRSMFPDYREPVCR